MITLSKIKDLCPDAVLVGDIAERSILALVSADVHNQRQDVLMWFNQKNVHLVSQVKAGVIVCPTGSAPRTPTAAVFVEVENPRDAFRKILEHGFAERPSMTIAPTAMIDPSVIIGSQVTIGHYVVIHEGCQIGDHVVIGDHTVIMRGTIIGNHVKIGANNVIGGVGFGYERDENGAYVLLPHIGNVVLKDYVEIGNCTAIDRAVLGSTLLEEHVKVDNLVHIAHGVQIGKNSLIIANAMVAGSVTIGENVWVAPSSSIINKVSIEDDALIGLGAVVTKPVLKGQIVVGNPAKPLERKK